MSSVADFPMVLPQGESTQPQLLERELTLTRNKDAGGSHGPGGLPDAHGLHKAVRLTRPDCYAEDDQAGTGQGESPRGGVRHSVSRDAKSTEDAFLSGSLS